MPSLTGSNLNVTITTKADTTGVKETEEALGGLSTKTAAVMGAIAGVAQSLATQGIAVIGSAITDAVKRVDTLNNASRSFENMGFAASDTKDMMNKLKDSILGLPTPLNEAVSGVELLAGATGDVKKSGEIFSALNDSILGFGGNSAMVSGAIIQISQAFSNGKIDAQTWNSLIQNGMGPALNVIAKQIGVTTGALKDGLSNGSISVKDFQDTLINLDKNGGSGMASLQKIAHDSTSGIGTGMDNAKTAMVRGLADIITAIGSKNISDAITKTGKVFELVLKDIAKAITAVINVIKDLNKFFQDNKRVITDVVTVITALLLPALVQFGIRSVISIGLYIGSMIAAAAASLVAGAEMALAWLLALGPIGIIIAVAVAAAALIIENWDSVKKFLLQVWSNIKQWGVDAWQGIVSAWQGAGDWFKGIFNGITNWAKTTCDDIVDFFKKLPSRIVGAIGNISSTVAGDIKSSFHSLHIPGFASGGFTGAGGVNEVAGIVHKGEYVIPQSQVNQSTGRPMGGGTTITINNLVLPGVSDKASFIDSLNADAILASRGLAVRAGA